MKAIKENKIYTIDEIGMEIYKSQGFDIYDDDGNLLEYGIGKKVSYEEYLKLKRELEQLQANGIEQEPLETQDVIDILKIYAQEHQISLGNANKLATIVKKIKEWNGKNESEDDGESGA